MKNNDVVRIALGIIFLAAALFRIIFFDAAIEETVALSLPFFFTFIIIGVEIVLGVLFLLNKWMKQTTLAAILFLGIALLLSVVTQGTSLLETLKNLFIFNPTSTDFFLHVIYVFLLLYLYKHT